MTGERKATIIAYLRVIVIIVPVALLTFRYGLTSTEFARFGRVMHSGVGRAIEVTGGLVATILTFVVIKIFSKTQRERLAPLLSWMGILILLATFGALVAYTKMTAS